MEGPKDTPITVAVYPVAWRVEIVNDEKHRGFEYVRSGPNAVRCSGVVH